MRRQVEGVAHVLRQATSAQTTPGLDTPAYTVLRRAGEYEVRRYGPYIVAEVGMPPSAAPASGTPQVKGSPKVRQVAVAGHLQSSNAGESHTGVVHARPA